MIETLLQLKLSSGQHGDVDALLVRGSDAQMWVREITSWPIEHCDLRLLVLPKSRSDLTPGGLLVFGGGIRKAAGYASPLAMQFTQRAGALFLPANGTLFPQVEDRILADVLPIKSYCVWIPNVGLTTFAESETLAFTDLLTCAPHESVDYESAVPGIALNSRLHSLTLYQPPDMTVEDVLGDGRGDIGGEATNLDQLKPIDEERDLSSMSRITNTMLTPLAKLVNNLISKVPRTASKRTWINGIEDWANQVLGKFQEYSNRNQFMDAYRLQKMLEENPDEGLKYAMPLSNMMSSTMAATGSWLSRRLVNFNFGNLGSGGAAGPGLPADLHSQLMRRYRELAEREIRLGRYRRAAYIYGNLLYDLSAAARTLESGKHFREAALIYQKKLNRNDEAARCLKEGGLFSEAIELYESLKQHENAGDLYSELGLEENARNSWRTAAEQFREKGNLLETARVEEAKLKDDEQAIATLESCWPSSYQAALCMNQAFRLLGRNGLHQRTRTWVTKFESEGFGWPSFPKLVELVSETATSYPDQATRLFAEETAFKAVSKSLAITDSNSHQLLSAIARLHSDDPLLRRDCNRYELKKPAKTPTRKPKGKTDAVTLVASHQLSKEYEWENAIGIQGGFLIVGKQQARVAIKRISSDFEESSSNIVYSSRSDSSFQNVILATRSNRKYAAVHGVFDTRMVSQQLAANDHFPDAFKTTDLNLDSKVIGVCAGPNNQWLTLRFVEGSWILDCLDQSGALVSSRQVGEHADVEGYGTLVIPPFYCDGNNTWIGQGNTLIQVTPKEEKAIRMPSGIQGIAGSVRGVATRIAVSLVDGFRIVWVDIGVQIGNLICDDMPSPKLLFTRTGHLVVASGNRCEVYHTRRNETRLVGKITIPNCRTLIRTDDSSKFGLLDENGQLLIYQIPL